MLSAVIAFSFLAIGIVFLIFAFKSFAKNERLGNLLGCTIVATLISFIGYATNYVSNNFAVQSYFSGLEHLSVDWVLFFFLLFVTSVRKSTLKKEFIIPWTILLGIDSLLLITNPANGLMADCVIRHGKHSDIVVLSPKMLFVFHLFICIIMAVGMIFELIRVMTKVSSYYRAKYATLLFAIFCLSLLNIGEAFIFETTVNYSRILYGICAILLYYGTYRFSPVRLLRKLEEYIDESIIDATVIYDNEGQLLRSNKMARTLFSESDLADVTSLDVFLTAHQCESNTVEINNLFYEISRNSLYDEKETFLATTFIFHDITKDKRILEREHRAANFDALTNCYNRRGFFEQAKQFLKECDETKGYAVMVSGICDFKGVNGLYGTEAGDIILKDIAGRFHAFHHRFPMLYARTGEGKFSSILPFDCIDEVVNDLADFFVKIRDDFSIRVNVCNGFVIIGDNKDSIGHCYEQALLALNRCKKRADTALLEYSKDMATEQYRKQLIFSEMHTALEKEQFYIEYQPQIDMKKKEVSGAEALVRWNHPILGKVSPVEFIPLFEANGFITRLDRFVWEEAAKTLKNLFDSGYTGSISVNVSRIDIESIDVTAEFKKLVEKYDIPISCFHIEITESACSDRKTVFETLMSLRGEGFVVEIDDFGSGYSSLNTLVHIPFDAVKLDMEFMRNNISDDRSDVVIKSIVDMVHELGAIATVEGVETEENLKNVGFFGGDVIQGYYYSRPISKENLIDFISKFNLTK